MIAAMPSGRLTPLASVLPRPSRWLMAGLLAAVGAGQAPAQAGSHPAQALQAAPAELDPSHAFDFELGEWAVRISRLEHPLTGSTAWVEYEGTSVVRKVWNGRANLGELQVEGPAGRIQGLSLRLYDPEARQWSIHWASSRDGLLGEAMVGGFRGGVGEFYNQERFDGRAVFVRFVFSEITAASFRLEQAFSDDGGRSWEANWIAAFER
jgi:hypothetical protein